MNASAHTASAPESYATFWEPIALDAPPAAARDPQDAYQDFVNQAEDTPVALRVERIDV